MAFIPTVTDDAKIQDALTLRYINTPPQEMFFNQNSDPAWKLIKDQQDNKNPGAGFVIQLVTNDGIGPNQLWAEAGALAEEYTKITVTANDFNWRAKWTRNAMVDAQAEGSKGVYQLATSKIDREIRKTELAMCRALEGDGWGTLFKVTSNDGNFVLYTGDGTTVIPALANTIEKNDRLVIAALPSSGNLVGSSPGTIFTVTNVDHATGAVAVDTDLSTATVADGYTVHKFGSRPYAASSGRQTLLGFNYWLPLSAITDSADPRYQKPGLQPLRFTPSGSPGKKEYLLQMAEFAQTNRLDFGPKGRPVFLVSPQDHRILANNIESTRIVVQRMKDNGETYDIGVPSVMLQSGLGDLPVIASAGLTPGIVRLGNFEEHFKLLFSGEKLINTEHSDGRVYRLANESGITDNAGVVQSGFNAEGFSRVQLVCTHPGAFSTGTGF